LTGKNVYAFCALGKPESFFKMLTNAGLDIREDWAFEDHHLYSQLDVDLIESDAQGQGHLCEALVVTAKDAVKLEGLSFETPCYVAEIKIKVDDDTVFRELL
ncbi:MAG: tetraacyldisaccharide 4'-kinase, partial [Pyrinomonadaceae bacterium]|nr:tetraacyldisaccharide 4'-kinase [Pyrinomonadaceae bacterium]